MKKILFIIGCLFLIMSFTACNKDKTSKVSLSENKENTSKFILSGNIGNKDIIYLTNQELEAKIIKKDSFLLCVYSSTCSSCISFKQNVLDKFVLDTKSNVHGIDIQSLESYKMYDNKPITDISPSIFIYNEGKIVSSSKYTSSAKEFDNYDSFINYVNQYLTYDKITEVNESYLDEQISSNKEFLLYIGWSKCGDCASIHQNVLDDYLIFNEKKIPFYYLEVNEYKTSLEDKWDEFASKYQFNNYLNGKVPTLQYYKDGLKDMIVYLNDVVENEKITNSYYKELVNTSYNKEENIKYHNEKVEEFLNKYYKK